MSESYYESGPQSVSQIVISISTGQNNAPCISHRLVGSCCPMLMLCFDVLSHFLAALAAFYLPCILIRALGWIQSLLDKTYLTYPTLLPDPSVLPTHLINSCHSPTQMTSQNPQITSLNPQKPFTKQTLSDSTDITILIKWPNDQISQFQANFTNLYLPFRLINCFEFRAFQTKPTWLTYLTFLPTYLSISYFSYLQRETTLLW